MLLTVLAGLDVAAVDADWARILLGGEPDACVRVDAPADPAPEAAAADERTGARPAPAPAAAEAPDDDRGPKR
jgi:hypothetical protein